MAKKNEVQSGTATEGMTRSEAIRKAFEKLGPDAMPVAVQKYVRDELGVEVSPNLVSNVKSTLNTKSIKTVPAQPRSRKKPGAGKKHAKPTVQAQAARTTHAANGKSPTSAGISLGDIETVKLLAQRNGAASLHALIDLLVK